jgi:lysophospholipase L1-like esterase
MAKKLALSRLLGPVFFLFGCILTLIPLEVGLRVFAYLRAPAVAAVQGDFRVVCLGGSHTEGLGADPKHSYCAELQKILIREGYAGARTYNLGRGGWNSHQIREQLPRILEIYRPHVIAAMIGEPNMWNYNGLREYLAETQGRTVVEQASDYLANLRVVRLVRLLTAAPSSEFDSSPEFLLRQLTARTASQPQSSRREALEEIFRAQEGKGPRAVTAAVELASIEHFPDTAPSDALQWLLAAFKASGNRFQRSLMLAARRLPEAGLSPTEKTLKRSLVRDLERALAEERLPVLAEQAMLGKDRYRSLRLCFDNATCRPHLKRIAEMEPENAPLRTALNLLFRRESDFDTLTDLAISWLRWNPVTANEAAIGDIVKLRELISSMPSQEGNLARIQQAIAETTAELPSLSSRFEATYDETLLLRWAGHDLVGIAAYLLEKKVPLVLQTFPPERLPGLPRRPIDAVILNSCDGGTCILSDTWSIFAPLSAKLTKAGLETIFSNKFGNTDAHLNEAGHAMIAEKLARDVLPFLREASPPKKR